MTSRRMVFKKIVLVTGLFFPVHLKLVGAPRDPCEKEIENLFLRLQSKEMSERASLFKKMIKRCGKEVLNIVEENTISRTEEKLRTAEITYRNLDAVMENLWNQTGLTHAYTIENRTNDFLKLKVTKCLYADEMKKLDAVDIGEAFYCSYDHGFCRGLNPDIIFTRTKTLMIGNDCCDHTYELKNN